MLDAGITNALVTVSSSGRLQDGADALRRAMRKAMNSWVKQVDSRLWHSIRHTTGTHLSSKGVPLRTVMTV